MVQKGLTRNERQRTKRAWRSALKSSPGSLAALVAPWRRNGSSDLDQMRKALIETPINVGRL